MDLPSSRFIIFTLHTSYFLNRTKVQAFLSQVFWRCQKYTCEALVACCHPPSSGPLRVGKLHLEFDETSEMQRVQFETMSTDATFSVLATCLQEGSSGSDYGDYWPIWLQNCNCQLCLWTHSGDENDACGLRCCYGEQALCLQRLWGLLSCISKGHSFDDGPCCATQDYCRWDLEWHPAEAANSPYARHACKSTV